MEASWAGFFSDRKANGPPLAWGNVSAANARAGSPGGGGGGGHHHEVFEAFAGGVGGEVGVTAGGEGDLGEEGESGAGQKGGVAALGGVLERAGDDLTACEGAGGESGGAVFVAAVDHGVVTKAHAGAVAGGGVKLVDGRRAGEDKDLLPHLTGRATGGEGEGEAGGRAGEQFPRAVGGVAVQGDTGGGGVGAEGEAEEVATEVAEDDREGADGASAGFGGACPGGDVQGLEFASSAVEGDGGDHAAGEVEGEVEVGGGEAGHGGGVGISRGGRRGVGASRRGVAEVRGRGVRRRRWCGRRRARR